MIDDSKKIATFRHNSSQRQWQDEQDLCKFQPDNIPALRRGNQHKFSSLIKKLLTIYFRGKKNNISLIEKDWAELGVWNRIWSKYIEKLNYKVNLQIISSEWQPETPLNFLQGLVILSFPLRMLFAKLQKC